ncbi:MAG TPA: YidB family protein [Bordetella sp.]
MGLLDTLTSITSSLSSNGSAAPQQQAGLGGLLPVVLEQLSKYPGGVSGLVAAFEQGGMGQVVGSWVGTGQNAPVSADQLDSVLHPGTVDAIAQQSGQSRGDVLAQLSQILPHIVDHATPGGTVPQGQQQGFDPSALIGMLSKLTGPA